jgi:predicted type IV restriction endonuclease
LSASALRRVDSGPLQNAKITITIGEENTKATLIDPILTALGWNLENIDEVRHEYKRRPQDNPVDYALFQNGMACLLIEAKSLEQDLNDDKWVSQNVSYAAVVGVEWCVLTNGDEWRIYNSHAVVPVDQKLFRAVRISDTQNEGQVLWALKLLSQEEMRGGFSTNIGKNTSLTATWALASEQS